MQLTAPAGGAAGTPAGCLFTLSDPEGPPGALTLVPWAMPGSSTSLLMYTHTPIFISHLKNLTCLL